MRRTKGIVVAAAALIGLGNAAFAGDPAAGEASFKRYCLVCHSIGQGAKNKIGPFLNGLDGRKAGTIEAFGYSPANKSSGLVWSEATFKDYIKDPKAKMPGTKMVFVGIKNEKEADDLWDYLKQFGSDGGKK